MPGIRTLSDIMLEDKVTAGKAQKIQQQEILNLAESQKKKVPVATPTQSTSSVVNESMPSTVSTPTQRDQKGRFAKGNSFAFKKFVDGNLPQNTKPVNLPPNNPAPSSQPSSSTPSETPTETPPQQSSTPKRSKGNVTKFGLQNVEVVKSLLAYNKGLDKLVGLDEKEMEILRKVTTEAEEVKLSAEEIAKYTKINTKVLKAMHEYIMKSPLPNAKAEKSLRKKANLEKEKDEGHSPVYPFGRYKTKRHEKNEKSKAHGRYGFLGKSGVGIEGAAEGEAGEALGAGLVAMAPEIGLVIAGAVAVGLVAKGLLGSAHANQAHAAKAKIQKQKAAAQKNVSQMPTNIQNILGHDPAALRQFEAADPAKKASMLESFGVSKEESEKYAKMSNKNFEKELHGTRLNPNSPPAPPAPPKEKTASGFHLVSGSKANPMEGLERYQTEGHGKETVLGRYFTGKRQQGSIPVSHTPFHGTTGGGGSTVTPSKNAFIASKTISPNAKALLDTIATPESHGDYHILEGGSHFKGNQYPDRVGAGGISTAAGKYQITAATWHDAQKALHLKNFSPANQDKAAWWLAQQRYHTQTGRNLAEDVNSKNKKVQLGVAKALKGTWTSLPGGHDALQHGGESTSKYLSLLEANRKKYHSQQYQIAMKHKELGGHLNHAHEKVELAKASNEVAKNSVVRIQPQAASQQPPPAPSMIASDLTGSVRNDDPMWLKAAHQDLAISS